MSPKRAGARLNADSVPAPLQPLARRVVATWRSRGTSSTDLVLASFPKSGSTWLRFVLASALAGREVDFDTIPTLSPPIGRHDGATAIVPGGGRLIKSHEQPRFGRNRPRVLCLVRDGRDITVSEYYHLLRRGRIDGEFDAFFPEFVAGRVGSYGTWHGHVRSWLDYRDAGGDVHVIRYEDLLADAPAALTIVDERFGLGLGAERIAAAVEANSKERMRAKEKVSTRVQERSVRAGIAVVREARSGGWRDTLSAAQVAAFERAAGAELRALGYPPEAAPPAGG